MRQQVLIMLGAAMFITTANAHIGDTVEQFAHRFPGWLPSFAEFVHDGNGVISMGGESAVPVLLLHLHFE